MQGRSLWGSVKYITGILCFVHSSDWPQCISCAAGRPPTADQCIGLLSFWRLTPLQKSIVRPKEEGRGLIFFFTVYMVLTHIGYLNRLVSGSIKDHLFFSPFSTVHTLLTSSPSLASEAHKSSCPESPDYPYSVQTDPSSCHPCSSQSSVLLRLLQISALWWTWWWWTLS